MINNIKNNTISEALAKQKLNALNEIKKAEIKNKLLISSQKKLLNLFDELLVAIFNNNKNNNNNNNVSMNANDDVSVNKNDNVSVNENDNDDNDDNGNDNDDDDDNDDDYDDDDDDDKDEDYYILNNYFNSIDETKSLKEQIEILKKINFLNEYWHMGYYHGDKELNPRIFKAKAVYILNDLEEKLFEKIFGHTFVALVDKVINTTNKEENKIIIDDIKKNRDKIYKQDDFSNFVIQPAYKRSHLLDAVKIIINFNEVLSLDDDNND